MSLRWPVALLRSSARKVPDSACIGLHTGAVLFRYVAGPVPRDRLFTALDLPQLFRQVSTLERRGWASDTTAKPTIRGLSVVSAT